MIGSVKSRIVASMSKLLILFNKNSNAHLTTIAKFGIKTIGISEVLTRVDTGASTCSIHATDVSIDDNKVTFKTINGTHTLALSGTSTVKNSNGIREVPNVKIDFEWNGKIYRGIDTKIVDRSKMKFKLLVGRNLIKDLKVPVYIDPNDDFDNSDDRKVK